ncbi:MAG: hypothetical protein AAGA61_09240 [Pseudomonadota bacterium]
MASNPHYPLLKSAMPENPDATPPASSRFASPAVRSALSALVALIFYAAWAAWANRMHDVSMVLRASATQGLYSAAVTLVMTSMVEGLYRGQAPRVIRFIRAVVATVITLVASSTAVHWLVGTAETLMTVLPSWFFGSLYACVYALGLFRAEARRRV